MCNRGEEPRPAARRHRTGWGALALAVLVFHSACATGVPRGGLLGGHRSQALTPPAAPKHLVTLTPRTDFAPVDVPQAEFQEAFTRLLLQVPVQLEARPSEPLGGRFRRASWPSTGGPRADVERGYAGYCGRRGTPGDCHSLLAGGARDTVLSERDRFTLGLLLALGPAMEGAAGVLQDFSTQAMTAVCTGLGLYFFMLLFPDPTVTKGIGAVMTLLLWSYLGTELWGLISATRHLWDEARSATTFHELREASERYGRVLGPNTLRLLIVLATWKAGAKGKDSLTGSGLPHFPRAVRNAAVGGHIRLPVAVAEAEGVSVAGGQLTLTLPSGSAAILAMQKQGEEDAGQVHHIATVENEKSALRGGPWTPRLKTLFEKAGMSMEDPANKVHVLGHRGPHPEAYHREIFETLRDATRSCTSPQQCRAALTRSLEIFAEEIKASGTKLNKLVTRQE